MPRWCANSPSKGLCDALHAIICTTKVTRIELRRGITTIDFTRDMHAEKAQRSLLLSETFAKKHKTNSKQNPDHNIVKMNITIYDIRSLAACLCSILTSDT